MKRVITCIVFSAVFFAVSCSYEDTATVTIDTGIRQQAQINWFDRVLAFLSLAQPLQADPVPGQLDMINKIFLTVSASDIETITQEIPITTGKITLEVPAGSQRTFTIVAGYGFEDQNVYTFYKKYGGITTVDLSPGQQVNLNIEMGELFVENSLVYDYLEKKLVIYAMKQFNPVAFKIYKKGISDNKWVLDATITDFTSEIIPDYQNGYYRYTIYNLTLDTNKYNENL